MTDTFVTAAWPIDLELRSVDVEGRTVEGIVVPYDETTFLTDNPAGERFARGSLDRTVRDRGRRVKLYRSHDHSHAVGVPLGFDAAHKRGLWASYRIAQTPAGDEVLAEIREGVLDSFSIGFRPLQFRNGRDGSREVTEAALHEVSIAPMGAYDGARVLALRTPTDAPALLPPMPQVNFDPLPMLR